MTTETILTPEQVDALLEGVLRASGSRLGNYTYQKTLDELRSSIRTIEQAVLQSEQVQALREDAEAFRLMVSKRLTVSVRELGHEVEVFHLDDCLAWPACDPNADDDTRAEVARYAIATAVAAMKEQK